LGSGSRAAQEDNEDEASLDTIIVTGSMRVTQGGSQDIEFFRYLAAAGEIPEPNTLTAEGLLSSHDIVIPSVGACEQMFCLTAEAMPAGIPLLPEAEQFVGLGFNTNLDARSWTRLPITLVATVDRSGSMSGNPIVKAKSALKAAVSQMHKGDRIAIVQYGSETYLSLPVTEIAGNRAAILQAIDDIEINGSTYMEAGLRLGLDTAIEAVEGFEGTTRVMLFTDERPNVGNTSAEGFMTMAREASEKGVGLTTIGVGSLGYGAELGAKISSVRGGNLFYLGGDQNIEKHFRKEFDFMVTEIAQDLEMTIRPREGWKVAGIYGVPGDVLGWQNEKTVSITVPSAFLSSNGGGIFVALGREAGVSNLPERPERANLPIAGIGLSYLSTADEKTYTDAIGVPAFNPNPSEGLTLAHLLVDEFTILHGAASAYHHDEDANLAFEMVSGLANRLRAMDQNAPGSETDLVFLMEQMLSLASENSEGVADLDPRFQVGFLNGEWTVEDVKIPRIGARPAERVDFRRGDELYFDLDYEEAEIRYIREVAGEYDHDFDLEVRDGKLHFEHWDTEKKTTYDYRFKGDRLILQPEDWGTEIVLAPIGDESS